LHERSGRAAKAIEVLGALHSSFVQKFIGTVSREQRNKFLLINISRNIQVSFAYSLKE
jgi:hypothetical protein